MNVSSGAKSATLGAIFAAVLIGAACFFVAIGLGYIQDLDAVEAQSLLVPLEQPNLATIVEGKSYMFTMGHGLVVSERQQLYDTLRHLSKTYDLKQVETVVQDVVVRGKTERLLDTAYIFVESKPPESQKTK